MDTTQIKGQPTEPMALALVLVQEFARIQPDNQKLVDELMCQIWRDAKQAPGYVEFLTSIAHTRHAAQFTVLNLYFTLKGDWKAAERVMAKAISIADLQGPPIPQKDYDHSRKVVGMLRTLCEGMLAIR